MKSRIIPIAHKEFLHIIRDWRTLGMAFGIPLVMLLLFGYAITFDIKDIRLAVYDGDKTEQSRALIDKFTSSNYFKLVGAPQKDSDLDELLDYGVAQIALSIPEDYSDRLSRSESVEVAIRVDGTESNTANIATGYVEALFIGQSLDLAVEKVGRMGMTKPPDLPPLNLVPRFWYNAELRSQNYIVPGLIASIMMVMTALLTSLTIVGERERGSLEQLISTPVRPYEIIIGKLLPYFVIGMLDSIMIALLGVFWFGVPFVGSIGLFLLASALFAVAGLGIGLTISATANNQVMAMQLAILTSMLPSFLLSGFMFAIKNMPDWVQGITYLVPARYFLVALRGVFLKDASFMNMWPQFAFMAALAVVMLSLAVKKFSKKIG